MQACVSELLQLVAQQAGVGNEGRWHRKRGQVDARGVSAGRPEGAQNAFSIQYADHVFSSIAPEWHPCMGRGQKREHVLFGRIVSVESVNSRPMGHDVVDRQIVEREHAAQHAALLPRCNVSLALRAHAQQIYGAQKLVLAEGCALRIGGLDAEKF